MENEYFKDFDSWNENKKQIETRINRPSPRLGEIWICDFGLNIGFEIDGKEDFKRPALVISVFTGGAIILPLTSKFKNKKFNFNLGKRGPVNLTQVRFMDAKRFHRKIDLIDQDILLKVKDRLIDILKSF
jgi:mRNA-degrading endonuclease toxin of MazEF toxin-antitoxin module